MQLQPECQGRIWKRPWRLTSELTGVVRTMDIFMQTCCKALVGYRRASSVGPPGDSITADIWQCKCKDTVSAFKTAVGDGRAVQCIMMAQARAFLTHRRRIRISMDVRSLQPPLKSQRVGSTFLRSGNFADHLCNFSRPTTSRGISLTDPATPARRGYSTPNGTEAAPCADQRWLREAVAGQGSHEQRSPRQEGQAEERRSRRQEARPGMVHDAGRQWQC
jgi:hypothetical protein